MSAATFLLGFLLGCGVAALCGAGSRNLYRSVAFIDAADLAEREGRAVGSVVGLRIANMLRQWSRKPGGGRENMPDWRPPGGGGATR